MLIYIYYVLLNMHYMLWFFQRKKMRVCSGDGPMSWETGSSEWISSLVQLLVWMSLIANWLKWYREIRTKASRRRGRTIDCNCGPSYIISGPDVDHLFIYNQIRHLRLRRLFCTGARRKVTSDSWPYSRSTEAFLWVIICGISVLHSIRTSAADIPLEVDWVYEVIGTSYMV